MNYIMWDSNNKESMLISALVQRFEPDGSVFIDEKYFWLTNSDTKEGYDVRVQISAYIYENRGKVSHVSRFNWN